MQLNAFLTFVFYGAPPHLFYTVSSAYQGKKEEKIWYEINE